MGDIGSSVEEPVNSMTTIALHDTESVACHMGLDDITQVTEPFSGTHHVDRLLQTLVGHFDEIFVFLWNIAYEERFVKISVESAMIHGDIHIAQITVL